METQLLSCGVVLANFVYVGFHSQAFPELFLLAVQFDCLLPRPVLHQVYLYWQILGPAIIGNNAVVPRLLCKTGPGYHLGMLHILQVIKNRSGERSRNEAARGMRDLFQDKVKLITFMDRLQLVSYPDPLTCEPHQIATSLTTRTLANHTE